MKQSIFKILSNTPLTSTVYKMVLQGDTSAITAPGQFVNIQLDGFFFKTADFRLRLRKRNTSVNI